MVAGYVALCTCIAYLTAVMAVSYRNPSETGARVAANSRRAGGQTASPEMPSTSHGSHLGRPEETSLSSKNFVSDVWSHDQTLYQCQSRLVWLAASAPASS